MCCGDSMTTNGAVEIAAAIANAEDAAGSVGLKTVDVLDFLKLELPPREFILEPILRQKDIAMLYSWRGVGKTYLALSMVYAIASGTKFLRWTAPRPRRVVYIDGEMPASTMQERLSHIRAASESEPPPGYFRIITPNTQEVPIPNLLSASRRNSWTPWFWARPISSFLTAFPRYSAVDVRTKPSLGCLPRSGASTPSPRTLCHFPASRGEGRCPARYEPAGGCTQYSDSPRPTQRLPRCRRCAVRAALRKGARNLWKSSQAAGRKARGSNTEGRNGACVRWRGRCS